jgi:hypothetical protein
MSTRKMCNIEGYLGRGTVRVRVRVKRRIREG